MDASLKDRGPRHALLTEGPVAPALLKMAASMAIGFIAGAAFNVTDTYFVGQLGTRELAAMGYTFPVVMVLFGVTMGIGLGASSVIARAIGQGDPHKVRRLTLHSLLLGLGFVAIFVAAGFLTMRPLFVIMGADAETLPLVLDYMHIWLGGILFLVIPMVGNNAIRATGDTLSPSLIMTAGIGLNIVLDPILIFGWGPVPALGIRGAAIATVMGHALALAASLTILIVHKRMLGLETLRPAAVWDSWRQVLYIGLPAAGIHVLMPVAMGAVTWLVSGFGVLHVAAMTAGMRVEHCLSIPIMALGASTVPFVGQNWGGERFDRVRRALDVCYLGSLVWGLCCVVGLMAFAGVVAPIFSKDPDVQGLLVAFLYVSPFALAFRGVIHASNTSMNAINRPFDSAASNLLRMFGLQLPLAFAGARLGGFVGIYAGITLSEVLAAGIMARWFERLRLRRPPVVPRTPDPGCADRPPVLESAAD